MSSIAFDIVVDSIFVFGSVLFGKSLMKSERVIWWTCLYVQPSMSNPLLMVQFFYIQILFLHGNVMLLNGIKIFFLRGFYGEQIHFLDRETTFVTSFFLYSSPTSKMGLLKGKTLLPRGGNSSLLE